MIQRYNDDVDGLKPDMLGGYIKYNDHFAVVESALHFMMNAINYGVFNECDLPKAMWLVKELEKSI